MNDLCRQKLHELIETYGHELCEDSRRVKGLLLDYCGDCKGEINLLVVAMQENVPTELLRSKRTNSKELLLRQLTQRLQEMHFLTEHAALWAVESWAFALDVRIKRAARELHKEADLALEKAQVEVVTAQDPVSEKITVTEEELGFFLTPLSLRGIPVSNVYLMALVGVIYVLNPIPGGIDLIPDFIPFVGNLDDGAAAIMVWYGLVELFEGWKFRRRRPKK